MSIEPTREQKFLQLPEAGWDGKCMLYSHRTEKFYANLTAAIEDGYDEYLEVKECDLASYLMIELTSPKFAFLDEDYFQDVISEDGELPDEVLAAIRLFNESVSDVACSWWQNGKRLKL